TRRSSRPSQAPYYGLARRIRRERYTRSVPLIADEGLGLETGGWSRRAPLTSAQQSAICRSPHPALPREANAKRGREHLLRSPTPLAQQARHLACFLACVLDRIAESQRDPHATPAAHFGLTEQAQRRIGLYQCALDVLKADVVGIAGHQQGARRARTPLTDCRNR